MKLLTVDCREISGRPGALMADGQILDLAAAPTTLSQAQWIPHSVVSILAAGHDGVERVAALIRAADDASDEARKQMRQDGVLLPFDSTALLPPIRRPGLMLVVNEASTTYIKSPNTAVGNGAIVTTTWNDDAPLVCNGMLAAVIGRPFYRAEPEEVTAAISGYTLTLDLSVPAPGDAASLAEWQRYVESKQFVGACPIGPAIITADEFGDPRTRTMQMVINDVEIGSVPAYPAGEEVAERVSALSQRYAFRPGDLVCFEPAADSAGRDCRLHAGDDIVLTLSELMSLNIRIAPR